MREPKRIATSSGRPAKATFGKPIPIRLSPELLSRVAEASKAMGEGDQVVMRLAMNIGLKYLARIDYDLEGAVLEKSTHSNL